MNSRREIERVLETWFADGPAVMPDRVFDAVFDRVERTPQRRLARLQMRLTEMTMTPRIRLIMAAAAALIVAVVGYSLIGRGPVPNIGATPSPSVAATLDSAVPTVLRARWNGGTRTMPGIQPESGTSILLDASSIELAPANDVNTPQLRSSVRAIGPGLLEFQSAADGQRCPVAEKGRYAWWLGPGSRTLTLTARAEECADRQAALAGTWWLEDCPIDDNGCYGRLEGGTYSSQFFDPFMPADGNWQPRFGALVFTVPPNWSNTADWPGSFTLQPPDAASNQGIFLVSEVVVPAGDDACSEAPSTSGDQTAQEIVDWLSSTPGISVTSPTAVVIGGLNGWKLDISMDPAWTTPCPAFSNGGPGRVIFVDRLAGEGFAMGLLPEQRERLFLLDLGDGRTLVIDISGLSGEDVLAIRATTVVESFQFTP